MDDMRVWVLVGVMLGALVYALAWDERRREGDRAERQHAREQATARLVAPFLPQPVPQTVTYSPHSQYQYQGGTVSAGALPGPAPLISEVAPLELPGITTLGQVLDTGWRPSLQSILLAQGPGGVPLTAAVGDELCHMILAGRTGAGKTNIMRLLLVQVLAAGCQVYLCNPKYTAHHWKTGERWDTLARATAPGRAVTDLDAICHLIRHLATVEFALRKASFEAGLMPGTPIVLFLDELPAIIGNDPDLMDAKTGALSLLLRQGREFLIEIVICSQDVLVETMGGNSGLRGQFQTRYYGGGDETSKRILLQPRPKEVLPEPPGRGVLYLWAVPTGRQPQMVRVPLVMNEDIERLLGAPGAAPSAPSPAPVAPSTPVVGEVVDARPEGAREGEPPWVPEGAREAILAGLRAGKRTNAIIKEIFGVDSGRRYIQAAEYIGTIMSDLARQAAA